MILKNNNNKIKISIGERIFDIFNNLLMFILLLIMAYPVWYVLVASFSDSNQLMGNSDFLLLPKGFNFESYKMMAQNPMVFKGYVNTIFIVVVSLIFNIVFTSMGAYCLSRKNVYWQKYVMIFIIITMYVSGGMVPTYLINTKLYGLNNSYWALILPGTINTYNMIVLKTAFASIPDSLIEAARIDGASQRRVLFSVVLPLSKATLAVIVLYYAVAHWNSWFPASIYLTDRDKYPLQLVLREILVTNDTSSMTSGNIDINSDQQAIGETIKYATIVAATIPILCVYPFLQKYFAKGTMVGAVKE